mgnify:FL=1
MKRNHFFPNLVIAFMLTSCFQDHPNPEHTKQCITVNASIQAIQTRAFNTVWEKNDAIGIYMKKSNDEWRDVVQANNVKYITDGTSIFRAADTKKAINFPLDGSDASFVAYYPYKATFSDMKYPVDVTDQSNLAAIDLLYSDNAKAVNSEQLSVNLAFVHQLTKIILNIIPEDPLYDLSKLSAKITGVGTKATFSLDNGELSSPTSTGNILFNVSANGRTAEAILLPMTSLKNKELILSISSNTFAFPLDKAINITSFEKSTQYTYNITLTKEALSVSHAIISDWIAAPSENIVIGKISTPETTGGTIDNPFTITEALANQGKTDVWVKGFIVGYYSGSSYKSFVNNANSVTKASNIALAATPHEMDSSRTFPVQLTTSTKATTAVKERLNLQVHPENLGKEIRIRGNLEPYFGTIGLKRTDMAIINGDTIPRK